MAKARMYTRADLERLKKQKEAISEKIAVATKDVARTEKARERKERTRRLIEIGAAFEGAIGRPITPNELESLKRRWSTPSARDTILRTLEQEVQEPLQYPKQETDSDDYEPPF